VKGAVALIAAMCVAEVVGMLGFSGFPALLPTFISDWGLSNTDAGWINAVFFAGYLVSVPVLVTLTDRVDPRRVYLASMVLTFVAVVGFPLFARGFWTALWLRTLGGIGLAGTYMPGLKALSDLIEGPAQSRAISFYTSSFGIGTSLSFYLSGRIGAWLGWQWAFGVAALGPLLALILVWSILPAQKETPRRAPAEPLRGFLQVFSNRRAMGYTLAYAFHNFELFGFRSWVVAFLAFSQGLQPAGSPPLLAPATLAALVTLLSLPSSVSGNEIALRFGRRRIVVAIMLTSGLLAVGLGFSSGLPFALVALLCIGYGVTLTADSSPITAGTVAEAVPGLRGATMAVHSCVGFLGSFLGPLAFGIALDATGGGTTPLSWGLAFATMGLGVALGPVCLALLHGRPRIASQAA
jgi:MFS family permease